MYCFLDASRVRDLLQYKENVKLDASGVFTVTIDPRNDILVHNIIVSPAAATTSSALFNVFLFDSDDNCLGHEAIYSSTTIKKPAIFSDKMIINHAYPKLKIRAVGVASLVVTVIALYEVIP